ncbi:MAG: MerR family transcriptional regulator [Clostridiaceae bacterium]|nr:MerR family transcriptional regulator [Clostridiaceae bacterium]
MKTVKEVSDLTGISVRMLHYYHKIGLLNPTTISESGYRLYDDEALKTLQQILFFKELEIPLKDVKSIMLSPSFDKVKALKSQKELLKLKRKRLDGLIDLIDKTLKGEGTMEFKEFDMTEYFEVLNSFKEENRELIIKQYGSIEKYDEFIERCKTNQDKIAKDAVEEYGSMEKFVDSLKKNFSNEKYMSLSEKFDEYRQDLIEDNNPKLRKLLDKLFSYKDKGQSSKEVQEIATKITELSKKEYEVFKMKDGDDHWYSIVNVYKNMKEETKKLNKQFGEFDKLYGEGACNFFGNALNINMNGWEPEGEKLYKRLTADLTKDPANEDLQDIIEKIINVERESYKSLNMEMPENHYPHKAELFQNNETYIKVFDDKYGKGASKFIGKALEIYINNK